MARRGKAAVDEELEEFVQGRYLALRRTAYLLCNDWQRAEDLVQSALVKVVVAARRRRVDNLSAYSRQVLLRLFQDENRRIWRHREKLWADPLEAYDAAAETDWSTRLTVVSALRR